MRHPRTIIVPCVLAVSLLLGGTLSGCSAAASSAIGTGSSAARSSKSSAVLPRDFPKADVPLVPGKFLVATGDAASGWSVTVIPSSSGGFDAAKSQLTSAGYTTFSSRPRSVYFSGKKYDVLLTTPGETVTYAVSVH